MTDQRLSVTTAYRTISDEAELRTASRSSESSATEASIRPREKSSISRPWTIEYAVRRGDRERGDQALGHAVGAVGEDRHRDPVAVGGAEHPVVHMVDGGVGGGGGRRGAAGLDDGGAALGTVGMKSFSSQAWSLTASAAFLPLISAWKRSGYCVAEWLPQMVILVMSSTGTPALVASCASARLWSRRVMAVNRSCGSPGRCTWRSGRWCWPGCP